MRECRICGSRLGISAYNTKVQRWLLPEKEASNQKNCKKNPDGTWSYNGPIGKSFSKMIDFCRKCAKYRHGRFVNYQDTDKKLGVE